MKERRCRCRWRRRYADVADVVVDDVADVIVVDVVVTLSMLPTSTPVSDVRHNDASNAFKTEPLRVF